MPAGPARLQGCNAPDSSPSLRRGRQESPNIKRISLSVGTHIERLRLGIILEAGNSRVSTAHTLAEMLVNGTVLGLLSPPGVVLPRLHRGTECRRGWLLRGLGRWWMIRNGISAKIDDVKTSLHTTDREPCIAVPSAGLRSHFHMSIVETRTVTASGGQCFLNGGPRVRTTLD